MRGHQSNASSSHRAVARLSPAASAPALDRGFSADRKRLQGQYPADFGYVKGRARHSVRAAQFTNIDDGD